VFGVGGCANCDHTEKLETGHRERSWARWDAMQGRYGAKHGASYSASKWAMVTGACYDVTGGDSAHATA